MMFTILLYCTSCDYTTYYVEDIMHAKFAIFSFFLYLMLCSCDYNTCCKGILLAKLSIVYQRSHFESTTAKHVSIVNNTSRNLWK